MTDPKYVEAINALIPIALKNTEKIIMDERRKAGKGIPRLSDDRKMIMTNTPGYDRLYHSEMNRLAREAGLRNIKNTPWPEREGAEEITIMSNTPEQFCYRDGTVTTVKAVMELYGLNYYTIASRRRRHPDACVEDIVAEQAPRKTTVHVKTESGDEIALREAAKKHSVSYTSLYGRYRKFPGKTLEFLLSGKAGQKDYLHGGVV